MIEYLEMNAVYRNCICLWAILLILDYIVITVLSVRQKRPFTGALAFLFIGISYFIMQLCRNISHWKLGQPLHPWAEDMGRLPFIVLLFFLTGLTLVSIHFFKQNADYARTHITPTAVKEAMDQNPTGICYYRENGQVILSNYKMNHLAFEITGNALLNGTDFYGAIQNRRITKLKDETVVRFTHRLFLLEGEACHELIADDITELYNKTEMLRQDNEGLKLQNQRMKEYGKSIDEIVRRQEVLNTKTKIHDEMNRLLLSTDNVIREGTESEKQAILQTWQKNILLLCMEADTHKKNNALSDLDALSKIIGVDIVYDKVPETEDAETLLLLSLAVEEAMINAVKHGGAKHLYVQVSEENGGMTVTFTNDGKNQKRKATEGGGLSTLRARLEEVGGTLQISDEKGFELIIYIPEGGKRNVL